MFGKKGLHLEDYLEFIILRKEILLLVFISSLVLTYAAIYFLIEEQFEATAMIIPREDDAPNMAGSLLRGMKAMPLGLGSKSFSSEMDLYKTIIYSRTMMEEVIRKFDLINLYKLDTTDLAHMEKAVKRLRSEVKTIETDESALLITVRSGTRQRAADMTNYILYLMNERIIDLKVSRSRENRVFLEKRVNEIDVQLRLAEDSLRLFQERTGLLDVKSQLQGILSTHVSLENELIAKRFQLGILERLYDKKSQQVKELEIHIQEFQKKLAQLRLDGDPGSPLLPLKELPKTSSDFLRLYREVEINNLLKEYIVPLFEQAKIEEKKDYPVLQVIDYAIPPAKKSYPQRVLFALIGASSVTLFVLIFLFLRESVLQIADPRWLSILNETKHWTWKMLKR